MLAAVFWTNKNKENYIQDLLTAKTSIAAQSDRLLTHYRSQIAQYEAEVGRRFVVLVVCIYTLIQPVFAVF